MVKPVNRERLTGLLRGICGEIGSRVLLVDDDDMMRKGMRLALEKDNWEVIEAENGRVALARLTETRPDVIMLDLMMPEMEGFEFLVEMRNRAEWRKIPVLVVTAKDLTAEERGRLNGDVERVLQKGASVRVVTASLHTTPRRFGAVTMALARRPSCAAPVCV